MISFINEVLECITDMIAFLLYIPLMVLKFSLPLIYIAIVICIGSAFVPILGPLLMAFFAIGLVSFIFMKLIDPTY